MIFRRHAAARIGGAIMNRFLNSQNAKLLRSMRRVWVFAGAGAALAGLSVVIIGTTHFGIAVFAVIVGIVFPVVGMLCAKAVNLAEDERTLAEEQKSDDRFRQAVQSAPNAIVMINARGEILLVNAQTERLFGYTGAELLGRPVELLVPERFRAAHPAQRLSFFQRPSARAMGAGRDLFGRRKDGAEIPIEIGLTPIESPEGNLVISAIVDITERKRAEHLFRQAVQSAPNAIVMINEQGEIVLVNPQTERMFGYASADLLGEPVELLVPDRFRAAHPMQRQSYFQRPSTRPMGAGRDLYGRRKDGSEIPIEIGLTPIESPEGILVLSAIVDITERKRAEQELRDAHETLERRVQERTMDLASLAVHLRSQAELLDLAPDAIMVRDMNGLIRFWNRGAEAMYGWSRADAEGKASHLLLCTEFPQPLKELEAIVAREGRWDGNLVHYRRDGTRIDVATRWALKAGVDGGPTSILEINTDITKRKTAEEQAATFSKELQQTNAELEAANKELEAFSYSISHDLRAPLRAIDGFSKILLQQHSGELHPEAVEYLHDVRRNTQRMGELVDDLLAFARLSRQPVRREEFSTKVLVDDCLRELQEQKSARCEFQIGDLPPSYADRSLLKQVWMNLLGNAMKYSGKQESSIVEIGVVPSVTPVTFFVRDNGVGFDMRYAHKLFGVFQRLHRAEDYDGTGVGLAIVQRIVLRHGGRVWSDAKPNEGATFFFTLEGKDSP